MNLRLPALLLSACLLWGAEVPPPPLDRIVKEMDLTDRARADSLSRYTCLRRYAIENRRFHKSAELRVRMTYEYPGRKRFEVLSETGSPLIRLRVLRRMLDAEVESSQDSVRDSTRIVASNYNFELTGTQAEQGRPAYVLEVTPKTHNRFLIRGRVWIDADDYSLLHVDAAPAQNPSAWIRSTRVVQRYAKFGRVWLPVENRAESDSFLFGRTEVTIESWDYQITTKEPSAARP